MKKRNTNYRSVLVLWDLMVKGQLHQVHQLLPDMDPARILPCFHTSSTRIYFSINLKYLFRKSIAELHHCLRMGPNLIKNSQKGQQS